MKAIAWMTLLVVAAMALYMRSHETHSQRNRDASIRSLKQQEYPEGQLQSMSPSQQRGIAAMEHFLRLTPAKQNKAGEKAKAIP